MNLIYFYPALFEDCSDKKKICELLSKVEFDEKNGAFKISPEKVSDLSHMVSELELNGDAQVELRLSELDYDLIALVQVDPLIDRERTPQGRASVRIVVGTLDSILSV